MLELCTEAGITNKAGVIVQMADTDVNDFLNDADPKLIHTQPLVS